MYAENDKEGVWGYASYTYVADWDNCGTIASHYHVPSCAKSICTCNAQLRGPLP